MNEHMSKTMCRVITISIIGIQTKASESTRKAVLA